MIDLQEKKIEDCKTCRELDMLDKQMHNLSGKSRVHAFYKHPVQFFIRSNYPLVKYEAWMGFYDLVVSLESLGKL